LSSSSTWGIYFPILILFLLSGFEVTSFHFSFFPEIYIWASGEFFESEDSDYSENVFLTLRGTFKMALFEN